MYQRDTIDLEEAREWLNEHYPDAPSSMKEHVLVFIRGGHVHLSKRQGKSYIWKMLLHYDREHRGKEFC
jgi:hypothetical protein